MTESHKMAIVVRKDLGMGAGKIAVQVAHAATSLVWDIDPNSAVEELVGTWFWESQKKIVLKVDSLEDLLAIEKKCNDYGIRHILIQDLGLTQIAANTITCLGIGPDTEEKINSMTKGLKLL